jgi:hypothetical protein
MYVMPSEAEKKYLMPSGARNVTWPSEVISIVMPSEERKCYIA